MWSLPLGLVAMIAAIGFGMTIDSLSPFLNMRAIVMVLGGSIAALALGNPSVVFGVSPSGVTI